MKAITTTTALILSLALPSYAGGPVIIEDTAEAAQIHRQQDRKLGGVFVGLIVIAAIIAASGGSGNCHGDTTPEPTPGGC